MNTKNTFLFLLSLFGNTFLFEINSQNYISFIDGNKQWTEVSFSWGAPYNHQVRIFSIDSDTLINTIQYHKITETGWLTGTFYVREDMVEKKVFLKYSPTTYEFLLYDFNLQVGDSFNNYVSDTLYENPTGGIVVTDRSNVFFAGRNRIRLTFDYSSYYGTMVWYEGIGSIVHGVFHELFLTGGEDALLCYFEDANLLYHNSSLSQNCYVSTEKKGYDKDLFEILLLENSIIINPLTEDKYHYSLFDITGIQLKGGEQLGNCELFTGDFSSGLYILRLRSSYHTLNWKIIVK